MKVQGHQGRLLILTIILAGALLGWANSYMGEYKGTYHPDGATTMDASAHRSTNHVALDYNFSRKLWQF